MLHSRLFFATIIFFFVSSAARAGFAADGVGTKAVRNVNVKLSALLQSGATTPAEEKQQWQRARAALKGFLDIEELGQRALVDHWTDLKKTQRQQFTTLLRDLIETNYLKGLRANLNYKVRYVSEAPQGEFMLVQTVIDTEKRGRPFEMKVDYLLRKSGNSWRAFDVINDGVSLVESYRGSFNGIIKKSGFDAVLGKMRKKLATLSADSP